MSILVSVVIPTYNRSERLRRCLKSVMAQTFRDFEIIVIDDASSDDTFVMLQSEFGMELEQGRIGYYNNGKRQERVYSRNKGMEMAKGECIAFLDDDDIWMPRHLSALVGYLEHNPDVACVFSNALLLYPGNQKRTQWKDLKTGKGKYCRDLTVTGKLVSPSVSLFRRQICRTTGGFLGAPPLEDWEFFSRIAMNFEIGYLDELSGVVHIHEGSYSIQSPDEYSLKEEEVVQTIMEHARRYRYPLDKRMLGGMYFKLARDIFNLKPESQKYLSLALKYDKRLVLRGLTIKALLRIMAGEKMYRVCKDLRGRFCRKTGAMRKDDWDKECSCFTKPQMDQRIDTCSSYVGWRHAITLIHNSGVPWNEVRVAEIGCGSGTFALTLAILGASVTLIDFNRRALEEAKKAYAFYNCAAEFIDADCLKDPPARIIGKFDVVISGGLAEHFSGEERKKAIEYHKLLLNDRGFAYVGVPNRFGLFYRAVMAFRKLTGTWSIGLEEPFSNRELMLIARDLEFGRYYVFGSSALSRDLAVYSVGLISACVEVLPAFLRRCIKNIRQARKGPGNEAANAKIKDMLFKRVNNVLARPARGSKMKTGFLADNFSSGLILVAFK